MLCKTRFILLLVILLPFPLFAQINTGTILGTVRDAQGAVVPGADVTVTLTELGVSVALSTNESGVFQASGLRPGAYQVRAETAGFKAAVRDGIQLAIQQRLELTFTLEVGDITEEVQVVAEALAVEAESGQLGTVIASDMIADLPLDGRRYSDLILLSPGAVPAPGAQSNPREARINVDGNFSLQNYFALNGVDNNTFTTNAQERSPQAVSPPPDALQSFKIQTRTYDAEFGWSQGAVINAELKSGANNIHGSGWYFLRNDSLNANNFFNNRAGVDRGVEKRGQYGLTIGGPVARNRTFFFADYQRTDATKAGGANGTVPTAQMKQGIFTGDRDLKIARRADGTAIYPEIVPCVDEVNDVLNLLANRTDGRPCADPAGMALVQLYPEANFGKFSYQSALDVPLEQNSFDVRLDHNLSDKDVLYASYSFLQTDTIVEQGPFPNPLATGGFTANSYVRGQLLALTWNRIFSPSVFNSLRFGFNRIYSTSDPVAPEGNVGPDYGLNSLPGTFAYGLPPIRVDGYTILGTSEWRPQFQVSKVFQLLDNLSLIRGNHSLKFGVEYKRALNDYLDVRAPNGALRVPNWFVGDGVANLLLGNIREIRATTALVPQTYTDGVMFYVQDAFKASSKLTLNFGVRYEYFTPILEKNDLISNFDPNANGGRGAVITTSSDIGQLPCTFECVQQVQGDDIFSRALVKPDRNNIAPRFGAAWRVSDNTVIRGGYAIFFQAIDRIGSSAALSLNPPQLVEFRGFRASASRPSSALLRDPFPSGTSEFHPLTIDIRSRSFEGISPWSQQYSFGFQFQPQDNYLLDISYVGGDSNQIRKLQPLNQGYIHPDGQVTRPFPDWPRLSDHLASNGKANYNALQASLRRPMTGGLAFNMNYTWSKALGDTQDNLSGGASASLVRPQNAYDLAADYGRLVFDQTHRFVMNWTWQIPSPSDGPARHVLGGWQFNGIWSSTSGAPIGIGGPDNSNTDSQSSRADCIGDPQGPRTVEQFFNTNAFAPAQIGTFGNCGVASLSGWPHHNFDLSLFKNFGLGSSENTKLQIRWEFFNAFNTPQFRNPERRVHNGRFGQTNSVLDPLREGRVIQFGLKFVF